MELIPSNTTNLLNFPFPPFWGVSNGMEHINNTLTILSLFFLLIFFFKFKQLRYFIFDYLFLLSNGSSNTTKKKLLLDTLFIHTMVKLQFR